VKWRHFNTNRLIGITAAIDSSNKSVAKHSFVALRPHRLEWEGYNPTQNSGENSGRTIQNLRPWNRVLVRSRFSNEQQTASRARRIALEQRWLREAPPHAACRQPFIASSNSALKTWTWTILAHSPTCVILTNRDPRQHWHSTHQAGLSTLPHSRQQIS
jgi:hypothetical protein